MVDLVKIRKKAKKLLETVTPSVSEEPGRAAAAEPVAEEPVAEREPLTPQSSVLSPDTSKLSKFKEDAGRLRDSADERETEAAPLAQQLEVLTFAIAGENYAVDIERIVEI